MTTVAAAVDTLPVQPLDYRPAGARNRGSSTGVGLLIIGIGVAAAVVGANPFADAAGFAPLDADEAGSVIPRILCGLVLGLLTLALARFIAVQTRSVAEVLPRARRVPDAAATLAILICGAACIVAAVSLQVFALRNAALQGQLVAIQQNYGGTSRLSSTASLPLITQVLSLLTFVAGVLMAALGIACAFLRGEHRPGITAATPAASPPPVMPPA